MARFQVGDEIVVEDKMQSSYRYGLTARTGREFTGTEEYAVAKMRLFQAFDEMEGLSAKTPDLLVDESNLDTLLSQLDL